MEVRTIDYNAIPDLPDTVLAVGFFDGFHKGHQKLLEEAKRLGQETGLAWGVLTFDPDPWCLFYPDRDTSHIYSLKDREQIARALGADVFYILKFTFDFAGLSPEQFHAVLENLHCKYLVCGFDFQYGKKNSGNVGTLSSAPFPVSVIDSVDDGLGKISSTRIEASIREGDITAANAMLGQPYSIAGTVGHGYKRGSSLLGFPTANIEVQAGTILPKTGVYAGFVQVKNRLYPCMVNVGKNPTFSNRHVSVEAFLFDFSGDLYDAPVRLFFVERLRDEKRFDGPEALKSQLEQDEKTARQVLSDSAWKAAIHKYWNFQQQD